jgi:hypothetical protein
LVNTWTSAVQFIGYRNPIPLKLVHLRWHNVFAGNIFGELFSNQQDLINHIRDSICKKEGTTIVVIDDFNPKSYDETSTLINVMHAPKIKFIITSPLDAPTELLSKLQLIPVNRFPLDEDLLLRLKERSAEIKRSILARRSGMNKTG